MNLIVAVDRNWGIGYNGRLLEVVKGDMQHFKNTTTNKVIVLGRETLKTFPNGAPLKNRTNIILTRDNTLKIENGITANSIPELLEILKAYNQEDIFIVGGASIYEQLLPYTDTAYITKFDKTYEADKYLPNLDLLPDWELTYMGGPQEENGIQYTFNIYKRKSSYK